MYLFFVKLVAILIRLFNGKIHIEGLEHVPNDRPVILAATHRSLLDSIIIAIAIKPQTASFMAKDSLFKWKPFAWFLTQLHVFPVNREKPSTTSIKQAVKVMNEDGYHLGIFPSGTRYATEIKGGTAFIQKLSKRDIVPIAIIPPRNAWEFLRRRTIKIAFGPAITYDSEKTYNKDTLSSIDQSIGESFNRLDSQLDPHYTFIPKTKHS